jgi:hypothetical protein
MGASREGIVRIMRRWYTALLATVMLGAVPRVRGGPHDFDFEFGNWTAVLRLRAPLSTGDTWMRLRGTSTVTPIWGGAANYGILDVRNGKSHVQGLTLRLYQPDSRQWFIRFADRNDGKLGVAAVGGFRDGKGIFYDTERLDGKPVNVRFVFSDITPASFRFQQSYSDDGGATWIVNWDATSTRKP